MTDEEFNRWFAEMPTKLDRLQNIAFAAGVSVGCAVGFLLGSLFILFLLWAER